MSFRPLILDRYILRHALGTMFGVLAVVMSLMILEHLPRLLELTRFSGHPGYIVLHTIAGLLPEYAGIGLLVGLFLAISFTVRRLALRGELDVIEACGIAPLRWMLSPLVLAGFVSLLTLINQGWLMPAGEVKIEEIGKRMEGGEFGHRLQAGELIDLGSASVLEFQHVDAAKGELVGLFLRTDGNTFVARRGRVWRKLTGETAFELQDGQVIQESDARVLTFSRLRYRTGRLGDAPIEDPKDRIIKQTDISLLWADGTTSARSAVYGRCLYASLALLLPLLALVLGKPARRQPGAAGILVGVIALVLGLKMIAPLIDGQSSAPELLAAGILATWGLHVSALVWAEKVLGRGFVDFWASRLLQNFRSAKG